MRILIRTSRTATWARRLGSLAVPLVIVPVLLHRERVIASEPFTVAALAAGGVALLALLVALLALLRLWQSGDQGWGRALLGLVLALLCLAPYAWYASLALRYPRVTDIATVARGQLPLIFEPGTAQMPPPQLLDPVQMAEIFPNVATRSYPLSAAQTFAVVTRMVAERGWTVRFTLEAVEANAGRINAQTTTLPGWREEAVLRVRPVAEGASVDMRSASLNAMHDFGSNGLRIEEFLTALDTEITTLLRDNPNVNDPLEPEADEAEVLPLG